MKIKVNKTVARLLMILSMLLVSAPVCCPVVSSYATEGTTIITEREADPVSDAAVSSEEADEESTMMLILLMGGALIIIIAVVISVVSSVVSSVAAAVDDDGEE